MVIPFANLATQPAARKASAPRGCAKFARLRCRSPCEYATAIRRGLLLASIANLAATRFMMDIFRGSLAKPVGQIHYAADFRKRGNALLDAPDAVQRQRAKTLGECGLLDLARTGATRNQIVQIVIHLE
jgi:hypothetical protein